VTDPTAPQPDAPRPDDPQPRPYDDWLLSEHVVPPPPAGDVDSAYLPPETDSPPGGWRSVTRAHKIVALVAAGVIGVGGLAVAAATGSDASGDDTTTNAAGQVPGGTQLSGGQAPGGAQGFGGPGGVAGEEHVEGTVTARSGSSVTVRSTDGTSATYTVTGDTQVVHDGALASLSDVQVGDAVLVHVLPTTSGGHQVAERVFAGTLPGGGFGPGGPDDTDGDSGNGSTDTGDTSTT
jgi:hypothetical protein